MNQGYGYPPPSPQRRCSLPSHLSYSTKQNNPAGKLTPSVAPSSNPRLPPRPPTSAQKFGHGAPSDYQFRYSNCSGRRKALLIGINYFGQRNQLKGCINDVHHMSTFLCERYKYRREDMVILTDDQKNPMSQPTKQNIIKAMQWLVKDAMPNDSLFLHFSGK
jgi:metacaspase-1